MRIPNVDPNFTKEQQQLRTIQALEQSQKASPISTKKALLILLPVFLLALVFVLYSTGVFEEGRTISWNGSTYRLPNDLNSVVSRLPDGYVLAGRLAPAGENESADWSPEEAVFVKPGNDRVIYLESSFPKGFFKARKIWKIGPINQRVLRLFPG